MATITFTIDNDRVQSIIDALSYTYHIPVNDDGTPLYTGGQWAKECIRRWVVKQVARYNQTQAQRLVEYIEDDTLLS
jgi:hypothetical protein